MDFKFTFKKMDSSDSLMNLAVEKITPMVSAYSGTGINPRLTFSKSRGTQKIHFSMLMSDGYRIEVSHTGPDIYSELDIVARKIETQLRRHKERRAHHKGVRGLRATAFKLPSRTIDWKIADRDTDKAIVADFCDDDTPIDATEVLKLEQARRNNHV